jgi:membrane associated rhomboid family serine protease
MKITDAVKHLIIINVIMFVATLTIGGGTLFYDLFAMHFPKHDIFKPWQIISHMFMHGDFMHVFFNMFALFMFGVVVEQYLGTKRFLILYFIAGLGAVACQLGYYYVDFYSAYNTISDLNINDDLLNKIVSINARDGDLIKGELLQKGMVPLLSEYNFDMSLIDNDAFSALFDMNVIARSTMVGASGCIMGVMVAFAMINPNAELMLILLPIPVKAKYFIPGIIVLDLISALTGHSFFSPSNTAYMAHVGGALAGLVIMLLFNKKQKTNTYLN